MTIVKYTEGYVEQNFDKSGRLKTQKFVAGDDVHVTITEQLASGVNSESLYHPFDMNEFTDRQKSILKMLLLYADMNVDDLNESFEYINDDSHSSVSVEGEIMPELETAEITEILELIT